MVSLPDRPVSPNRNLVTALGLAQIEAAIHKHREALKAATAAEDGEAMGREERDLRYWLSRRGSAELMEPDADTRSVVFGTAVTVEFEDGHQATYRIVGEDEGEPETGRIAWTAAVAKGPSGCLGRRHAHPAQR